MIAAQLVAANIIRGEQVADYFKRDAGVILDTIKDDKLNMSVRLAKRLIELAGN